MKPGNAKIFNKQYGARVLRRAFEKMPKAKTGGKKPFVRVLSPFKAVNASSLRELEKKIIAASSGKKCERVFIRGNPNSGTESGSRERLWVAAPRGHFCRKENKIYWDTMRESQIENYNFLLYETKSRAKIAERGSIILTRTGKNNFHGSFVSRNKIIEFRNWNVGNRGYQKQLSMFLKALIQNGGLSGFEMAELRFVRWKGEREIELFDFNAMR